MNGDVVAAKMKRIRSSVPIMLLSAYGPLPESKLKSVDTFLPKSQKPRGGRHGGGGYPGGGQSGGQGRGEEENRPAPADDIEFLNHMLDQMTAKFSVDTARIYATGLSEGGFMAMKVGCAMADRIAAIAPVGLPCRRR
jgi:dienelactone hydrolase